MSLCLVKGALPFCMQAVTGAVKAASSEAGSSAEPVADTSSGAASSVEIYRCVRGCVIALSVFVLGCPFMFLVGLCVGRGGAWRHCCNCVCKCALLNACAQAVTAAFEAAAEGGGSNGPPAAESSLAGKALR